MSEEIKKPRKKADISKNDKNNEKVIFSEIQVSSTVVGLPVVPVRDIVVFPGLIVSLFIGRKKSIKAINTALAESRMIALVTQKDSNQDEINTQDIPNIAVLGTILQCIVLPDETVKVLVDCNSRILVNRYYFTEQITCDGDVIKHNIIDQSKAEVFLRSLIDIYETYASLNKKLPQDSVKNVNSAIDLSMVCDIVASYLTIKEERKMEIALMTNLEERVQKVLYTVNFEINILKAEKELHDTIRTHMDKNQKEYYLNEQMKVIKKELGEHDDVDVLIDKYRDMMKQKPGLTVEAINKIEDEFKKLKHTPMMSSEASISKAYLDWIFTLPWAEFGRKDVSMSEARKILDKSHYGMDKIKTRIEECLAVEKNTKKNTGTVLCLFGSPGVGKTTLARSIANAMGREYVKISLGGLHDSSELFGHIRTYIGALPGRIIKAMKKAKVSDPLILLDEIDKMSSDHRGDPVAAMLEILDPEQNSTFYDHYMEIGYDLSNVVFVATANSLNLSPPLRDRMEIIHVPSYLEQEKVHIASNYVIPKQMETCNLSKAEIDITDRAITHVIQKYTREAGVRELERCFSKIIRKVVVKKVEYIEGLSKKKVENEKLPENVEDLILESEVKKSKKQIKKEEIKYNITIDHNNVGDYLGIEKFTHSEIEDEDMIGVVNGLAYTDAGGDVLLLEGVKIPGKGLLKFTGSLGDVMKESMQAAHSYIQANAEKFGIDRQNIKKYDIHIHAPEGATPKDGPSAGVTISTAIVSLLTDVKVRKTVAMTGEITLRGKVLAIGGLREKLVSAVRAGITDVVIPRQNVKDLEDIPADVKNKLKIHPCEYLQEVLDIALAKDGERVIKKVEKTGEKPIQLKQKKLKPNKKEVTEAVDKDEEDEENEDVPLF